MLRLLVRDLQFPRRLVANCSQRAALQVEGMTDDIGIRRALTKTNCERLAREGAAALRTGGIIAVPTDTVYGLAADAQSSEAIKRLYDIKGRDAEKPIAICVANIQDVYTWGKVTIPEAAVRNFLPGPVTLVFERSPLLNPKLNPGTHLVGIRIPDNEFIRKLAEFHGGPIALTSANVSSDPSTLSPEEFKHLWPCLNLVFDGGNLLEDTCEAKCRAGSTVVDLSKENEYRIIREGSAFVQVKEISAKYRIRENNVTN